LTNIDTKIRKNETKRYNAESKNEKDCKKNIYLILQSGFLENTIFRKITQRKRYFRMVNCIITTSIKNKKYEEAKTQAAAAEDIRTERCAAIFGVSS